MTDLQHAHFVEEAVCRLIELYDSSCFLARESLATGDFDRYRHVVYPKITVHVREWQPIDRSEPFGYVDQAGRFSAVISKPQLLRDYLTE